MIKSTLFHCPICDWSHDEPEIDVQAEALSSVFGLGVMSTVGVQQRNHRIEKALAEHFATHSLVDWVRETQRKNRKIAEIEEQLAQRGAA